MSSRLLSHGRTMGMGATRMERRPGTHNAMAALGGGGGGYSSSSEEEDDYYGNDEERNQERLLSALHGEAAADDDPSNKNKSNKRPANGGQTDQEIADEYAGANGMNKPKKPRLTLQPEALIGPQHGLLVIQKTFPSKLQKFLPSVTSKTTVKSSNSNKKKTKSRVDSAALFSRKLVSAYFSYCEDLFPSLAHEDVLLKIESFGSRKQIKDYQQHLREQIRNAHVERLYGLERGESMVRQLQEGLQQQEITHEGDEHEDEAPMSSSHDKEDPIDDTVEQHDKEINTPSSSSHTGGAASTSATQNTRKVGTTTNETLDGMATIDLGRTSLSVAANKRRIDESSDEEEELTFEDEVEDDPKDEDENVPAPSPKADDNEQEPLVPESPPNVQGKKKPTNDRGENDKNPSSHAAKRHIDESSDEEEEEATFDDINKEAGDKVSDDDIISMQAAPKKMHDDSNEKVGEETCSDVETQEIKGSDMDLETQEPVNVAKETHETEEIQLTNDDEASSIEKELGSGSMLQTDEKSQDTATAKLEEMESLNQREKKDDDDDDDKNKAKPFGDGTPRNDKSDPK